MNIAVARAFVQDNLYVVLAVTNLIIAILWSISVVYVVTGQKAETEEEKKAAHTHGLHRDAHRHDHHVHHHRCGALPARRQKEISSSFKPEMNQTTDNIPDVNDTGWTIPSVAVSFSGSAVALFFTLLTFLFSGTWTYVRALRLRMDRMEALAFDRDALVEKLCVQLNAMLKDGRLQLNKGRIDEIQDKTRITLPIANAGSMQLKLDAGVAPSAATVARYGFSFVKWVTGW